MAFDRPIEADSVDNLGLLSSLIRAPILGIMWLLGGEHTKEDEKLNQESESIEKELSDTEYNGRGSSEAGGSSAVCQSNGSDGCHPGKMPQVDNDPPDDSAPSIDPINQAEVNREDKENDSSSSPQNQPFLEVFNSPQDESKCKSTRHSSTRRIQPTAVDPAIDMIDDLVAVMERRTIANGSSLGPATSAVLTSQDKMPFSSTTSLSVSYSASTFSNPYTSPITDPPSLSSTQNNSSCIMRGMKKTSWSDECGNRSLVEYSYFDDSTVPPKSNHWSAMRRISSRSSRHSFDGAERGFGTRRGEIRVIKSALKRSGSYSPPVTLYANNSKGMTASNSSPAESSSSTPELKSFRSISVIGSSFDSSTSDSSEHGNNGVELSRDTVDSRLFNTNECVPSTLQFGCGRASGGLIIPRGGPSDPRYHFPGCSSDSRYKLILGASIPTTQDRQAVATKQSEHEDRPAQDASYVVKASSSPNPATSIASGRNSPGQHHFLPRHPPNGYISPQYGFYVNITPPTPELHMNPGDKISRHATMQQQSYLQFQFQDKSKVPSPIPEGSPDPVVIPQRFVGRSSVPRPSSNRSSSHEQNQSLSSSRQNSLKPTFTKNMKGMGMLLAESADHGVWPTVPFG
ncbi:hypothetical protein ACHAXA_005760 [Cyclostephanos tholiformis]|uniref:Uncharacterized protein n=1 Tax=Cyclostephanos tholiformis TaxID=382380 RepID=A0ABD3RSI6_9STRA